MKKYLKVSSLALAISLLVGGGSILTKTVQNQRQNDIALNEYNRNLQADSVQVVNSVNDIVFSSSTTTIAMFALVKDDSGDRIYGWGNNDYGQLGTGDTNSVSVPTLIPDFWHEKRVSWVLPGENFTLIILNNREVWATGVNGKGQFGNGTSSEDVTTSFSHSYDFDADITKISVGRAHVYALTGSKLWNWGSHSNGQLGTGWSSDFDTTPSDYSFSVAGTIIDVDCYYNTTIIVTDDAGEKKFYFAGDNNAGWPGESSENLFAFKLLNFGFSGKVSKVIAVGNYGIFAIIKNGALNELYAWGSNTNGSLGMGDIVSKTPTKITWPDNEEIVKIVGGIGYTQILTKSGAVYTAGAADNNGLGVGANTFTKIGGLSGVTEIFSSAQSTAVLANDKIYAFGSNTFGQFGNGTTTGSNVPIPVDPFSTPSVLVQNSKTVSATIASDFVTEIYSVDSGLNSNTFKDYIDTTKFPADVIFTTATAPKSDNPKGEVELTVTADRSYADIDGAHTLTPKDFTITLKGFKPFIHAYSRINTLSSTGTIYNLNNIVSAMRLNSTNKVDPVTFVALFEAVDFEPGNEFTISDDKIENGIYSATLHATMSWVDGYLVTGHQYNVTIDDLKERPDSTLTIINPINSFFNIQNIVKAIKPNSDNKVDPTNLALLCDASSFPLGVVFTIKNYSLIGNEYTATITASTHYLDGNIDKTSKDYPIAATILADQPDSSLSVKTGADKVFNANNIVKKINPKTDGQVNADNLKMIADTSSFPAGNVFTVSNDTVSGNVYNATFSASEHYADGLVDKTSKSYTIQITGLASQPDSTITVKTGASAVFNANNIIKAINPDNAGKVNIENLQRISDVANFPSGTDFSVANDTVVSSVYNATIKASKHYFEGNVTEVEKSFPIQITGLVSVLDSIVTVKAGANTVFNANNIVKKINPDTDGKASVANLALITDQVNFPVGNEFTVSNDTVSGSEYNATITASKYYFEGNVLEAKKSFNIKITGLVAKPDSAITVKPSATTVFNANNIIKKINPDNDGKINMTNFKSIIETVDFPTDVTFSISNDTVVDDEYNATITASKYYFEGNIVDETKKFNIKIAGLEIVPETTITNKAWASTVFNANNIVKSINPNMDGKINITNFEAVFNIVNLPAGAVLAISEDSVTDGVYTAKVITDKYYSGGNIISVAKTYAVTVTDLVPRPDSTVIVLAPSTNEKDAILNGLVTGEPASSETMKKLIDISQFPEGTEFIIDSVVPSTEEDNVEFSFTPNKKYKDGNAVDNTGSSKQQFTANVLFVPVAPPPPVNVNMWISICLGIASGVLLLITIGLFMKFMKIQKRRNLGDYVEGSKLF